MAAAGNKPTTILKCVRLTHVGMLDCSRSDSYLTFVRGIFIYKLHRLLYRIR